MMRALILCLAFALLGCLVPKGPQIVSVSGRTPAYSAAFSPDARRIAFGGQNDVLEVWDLAGNKRLRREEFDMGTVEDVIFATDGSVLAANGGRVFRVPIQGPATKLLDTDVSGLVRFFDGGRSLVSNDFGKVTVTRIGDGLSKTIAGEWMESSPWEGQHALVLGSDDRLQVVDAASLSPKWKVHLPVSSPERVQTIAVSDDAVFVGTTAAKVYRWVPGSPPTRIASFNEDLLRLSASNDGRFVVASGHASVMDGRTGTELHRIDVQSSGTVAFSPNGDTFVMDVPEGARLWRTELGKALTTFFLAAKPENGAKSGQGEQGK